MDTSAPYPEATSPKESRRLRRWRSKAATAPAPPPPGAAAVEQPPAAVAGAPVGPVGPVTPPALKGGLSVDPPEGFGVSLSGGGIRAASYALGVLQEMHRHDMLTGDRRATWLSAVSGGSYIAGGLASVAGGALHGTDPDALELTLRPASSPGDPDGRPFATGTPEERYLRNHTRYLTHVTGGWPGTLWRMVLGIAINVGFIALALHALLRPAGWLYGWAIPALRTHTCTHTQAACAVSAVPWHVDRWDLILVAAAGLAGLGTVLGLLWVGVRWTHDRTRAVLGYLSGGALGLAAAVLVLGVGVVAALHILRTTIGHQVPPTAQGVSKSGPTASARASRILGVAVGGGLLGVIVAAAGAIQHAASTASEFEKATARRVLTLLRRFRGPLLNLLAAITGPALLLLLSLLFLSWGAASPPYADHGAGGGEILLWAVPVVVLVAAWWFADLVVVSASPYKRGLSLAFTLRRVCAVPGGSPTSVGTQDADERPYDKPYQLSAMQPSGLPKVLICAAANVSDYGSTPTGSNATSFVFSSDVIGGPLVGAKDTLTYEDAVHWRCTDVTLPAAVSIAGAAFSPSMGKMTRAPLRFILALTNLRLGVWIPNPRRLAEFEVRRHSSRHLYTPRPTYLLRELFGRNHLDAPYLYVTDGGHYENLGLVELLRRKCAWIWAVDAAGDTIDAFSTVGEAMALAYAELDIDVQLDPTIMAPDPAATGERLVRQPYAVGSIRYPDGSTGRIVFIKAGVSADAPWAVRAFHRKHPGFPCDPTLDQFYDADRFDAYRELGTFAMQRAWDEVGAEFDSYRSGLSSDAGPPANA